MVRCPACRQPLSPLARVRGAERALTQCPGCAAAVRIDEVAIDVVPHHGPPQSLGLRAMQSRWLAAVYERLWRPVAFGVSTRFTAPRAAEEARIVLDRIADTAGPWLDLSCGPGILTRALVDRAAGRAVYGVDLSRAMLDRAHAAAPAAAFVRADAAALPFGDDTFGAVVNLATLDLYPEPGRVIGESARVLARGGRWVCSTFVSQGTRSSWLARLSGVRMPTLDHLATMVKRAGLDRFGSLGFHGYVVAWADKV